MLSVVIRSLPDDIDDTSNHPEQQQHPPGHPTEGYGLSGADPDGRKGLCVDELPKPEHISAIRANDDVLSVALTQRGD